MDIKGVQEQKFPGNIENDRQHGGYVASNVPLGNISRGCGENMNSPAP